MQRLADHFKTSVNEPDQEGGQPAAEHEDGNGRGALRQGRFHSVPVWYHATGERADPGARTDDGDSFDPDDAIACLQFEHYVGGVGQDASGDQRLLRLYYLLKPLMPRRLQVALQRANARRRLRNVAFPSWPADATLTDLLGALLAEQMRAAGVDRVPFIGFWPRGKTWALCLTHDIETEAGQSHVEPMAQAEEERGFQSSWYFVPELYRVDHGLMETLRGRDHEIGVHGLEHSDRLFASRSEFEWRCGRINEYVREWDAVGFRSPATYRNPFWLPEIDVDYDSSYMDNATLEPQRGGVCTAFPFMLSDRMVELPITLPMDHTLINILRRDVVDACVSKLTWVRQQYGLALSLFHPDYNTSRDRISRYGALLDRLHAESGGWHALPRDIAAWWQRRRRSQLVMRGGELQIEGPAAGEGTIWWAHREGDSVRIEPPAP